VAFAGHGGNGEAASAWRSIIGVANGETASMAKKRKQAKRRGEIINNHVSSIAAAGKASGENIIISGEISMAKMVGGNGKASISYRKISIMIMAA